MAKIEAHIAAHPDDGRAYEVVAPVYLRMGRYDDAVHARAQAITLLGDTAERRVRYAEALAYAADGVVTPEAEMPAPSRSRHSTRNIWKRAISWDWGSAARRQGRGAKIWQRHDRRTAGRIAGRQGGVAEKLAMLDAPARRARRPRAPARMPPASAAAVAAQPRDEQQKTINAMVERLAQRLAAQGGDAARMAAPYSRL